MAGGLAIGGDVCNLINYGALVASSTLTTVTASGTADTAGAYTQLTASTTADISYLCVLLSSAGSNVGTAVNIAIGASGSEQVKIANLMANASYAPSACHYTFPFTIKKGTRIAASCQSSTGGTAIGVAVIGASGGFAGQEGTCGVDAISFNAATSFGSPTGIIASANTLSAYGQLVATTARNYTGLFGCIDAGTSGFVNLDTLLVNIAFGASGSEKVRIPNLYYNYPSGVQDPIIPYFAICVPKGTRIAANYQDAAGNAIVAGINLYGTY